MATIDIMSTGKVVGGPTLLIVDSVTIGATNDGFKIRGTAEFNEVLTHESGPAPVMVAQQGSRRMEISFDGVECDQTQLLKAYPDMTTGATTTQIAWHGGKGNAILSGVTVEAQQSGADGTVRPFVFNNAVPIPDSLEIDGMNADGTKWMFNAKFVALYSSATMALISNTTA